MLETLEFLFAVGILDLNYIRQLIKCDLNIWDNLGNKNY